MTSKISLLLCAALFLSGFIEANATEKLKEAPQSGKWVAVGDPPPTERKSIADIATLLADNDGFLDKKKISEYTKAINKTMGYGVTLEEELLNPSIELYGASSWHRDAVNPFRGGVKAVVPDSFQIDLTQFVYPLDELKRVTSRYGYRRRSRRMHYGIDLSLTVGDTIRAAFDGKVRIVDYERRGYGHYIVVRHTNGLETLYAHNSKVLAKEDEVVRAGDPIAIGGNTGRSTGPHLHFEARYLGYPLNPEELVDFKTGVPKIESYLCLAKNYMSGNGSGNGNIRMHRIKSGDTLSAIAQRYGTSVSHLCKINNMTPKTTLQIGRSIRVS